MTEMYEPINTCAPKPRPRKRAQGRAQDVAIRQPRNQNLEQPPYISISQFPRYHAHMGGSRNGDTPLYRWMVYKNR